MLHARDNKWPIVLPPVGSAVAEVIIAPTVVELDEEGRAVSVLATVPARKDNFDLLPWAKWVELETECPDDKFAKLAVEMVVQKFHRFLTADTSFLPLALIRKGKEIQAQASNKIEKGECVVPIFSGRHTPW